MNQIPITKKLRNPSLLKKRRERISMVCPHYISQMYMYLSRRQQNKSWRYLCYISDAEQMNNYQENIGKYVFNPEHNEKDWETARILRDLGIGKMHFCFPVFALCDKNSLVLAKLALDQKIVYIYDIEEDKSEIY